MFCAAQEFNLKCAALYQQTHSIAATLRYLLNFIADPKMILLKCWYPLKFHQKVHLF